MLFARGIYSAGNTSGIVGSFGVLIQRGSLQSTMIHRIAVVAFMGGVRK